MNSADIASIRQEYLRARLDEQDTFDDPVLQFQHWFQEALNAEIDDVNAFSLATVDADGRPHNRIVLLKGLEEGSFVFFTNYQSHKGREIAENHYVAMNFFWVELQRQVRVEGIARKLPHAESEAYFHSRPVESQIGAWASHQSDVLRHREDLEQRFAELSKQYEGQPVPCPPHWGGYAITPQRVEFWQGRLSRLHDRIVYERGQEGGWKRHRLNP